MAASGALALLTTLAIPIVCIGASTWGWRHGGSRIQVVAFNILAVVVACVACAMMGRALDLDAFAIAFVVLTIGLAAGTVMLGKKRLNLT